MVLSFMCRVIRESDRSEFESFELHANDSFSDLWL